jgi:hypothetical protein
LSSLDESGRSVAFLFFIDENFEFETKTHFNVAGNNLQFWDVDGDGEKEISTHYGDLQHQAFQYFDIKEDLSLGFAQTTFGQYESMTGSNEHAIQASDFNGDGISDLVLGNDYTNQILLYMGTSPGEFAEPSEFSYFNDEYALWDLDGDGDMDVMREEAGWWGYFYENDGNGDFLDPVEFEINNTPLSSWPMWMPQVVCADFNGDGLPDLAREDGLIIQSSPLEFIEGSLWSGDYSQAAFADFNGDGSLDVVGINNVEGISLNFNNGSGEFSDSELLYPLGQFNMQLVTLDIELDDDIDIVVGWRNEAWVVFRNDGNGSFSDYDDLDAGFNFKDIIAADYDSDGDMDIIGSADGHIFWRENTEGGFVELIDIDGDNEIGIDDLLAMLSDFGCTGQDCAGDINGDGIVNTSDFLMFLSLF